MRRPPLARRRLRRAAGLAVAMLVVAACSQASVTSAPGADAPAPGSSAGPVGAGVLPVDGVVPVDGDDLVDGDDVVDVVIGDEIGPVSPLILGLSGTDGGVGYLRGLGATFTSWGGNPSSRYNFELGHAWNTGADWGYRNVDYGHDGDAADAFLDEAAAVGAVARVAVPTLGWVAADDRNDTCSFPDPSGGCGDGDGADCTAPGPVADPRTANVASTAPMVQRWVAELVAAHGSTLAMVAMDNEPELWGHTHYDVHPTCPTYEEILSRYLEYATAVRQAAPGVDLAGPVACCWFPYWRNEPGPASGAHASWLPWFLDRVREHDEANGGRILDVLDVHYYPQSGVYNDVVDDDTAARRLRSVRSLHDPGYVDESWIDEPIRFIPYLRELVDRHYPGTRLVISEWNMGADTSMNGALAIADVLGVLGREGVHAAAYWRNPPAGSPGYFAFKVHGNYDDRGGRFGGVALDARSSDPDRVRSYATRTDRGWQVLLLNLDPTAEATVSLGSSELAGHGGTLHRYSQAAPERVVAEPLAEDWAGTLRLPAYSITLVVVEPAASDR